MLIEVSGTRNQVYPLDIHQDESLFYSVRMSKSHITHSPWHPKFSLVRCIRHTFGYCNTHVSPPFVCISQKRRGKRYGLWWIGWRDLGRKSASFLVARRNMDRRQVIEYREIRNRLPLFAQNFCSGHGPCCRSWLEPSYHDVQPSQR
jgi:hypothetical protein